MNSLPLQKIVKTLQTGGVIAYPTEAIFGLGCDPLNETAVTKILELKKRSVDKGLILIASAWEQIAKFTTPLSATTLEKAFSTWPGPTTWIFPASKLVPTWITGNHKTIALRITAHPVVREICGAFAGAIVSTSANIEGRPPAKTATGVTQQFPTGIDLIVPAQAGNLSSPTTIKDIITEQTIR